MYLIFFLLYITCWAQPLQVEIHSRSAIMINAETGAVLFSKEPHQRAFPASTTKVATALVLLDREAVDLAQKISVSREALRYKPLNKNDPPYGLESGATIMGLRAGEIVSLESLLYGLMLASGGDAANVIAEAYGGGSIPSFMEEMNSYLKKMGCMNTHFVNPHGLSHPDHYTTAYDLMLIARRAMQFPLFQKVVSALSYHKPATNRQPEVILYQNNPLLKKSHRFYYPKAIGIKTGYTALAQSTCVAAASHAGRTLIVVLLGSENREGRFIDARALFDAAFAEKLTKRTFFEPGSLFHRPLQGRKNSLQAHLTKQISLSYYPSEEPQCRIFVRWLPLPLPIQQGQKVGEVQILTQDNTILAQGDLLSDQEVAPTFFEHVRQLLH